MTRRGHTTIELYLLLRYNWSAHFGLKPFSRHRDRPAQKERYWNYQYKYKAHLTLSYLFSVLKSINSRYHYVDAFNTMYHSILVKPLGNWPRQWWPQSICKCIYNSRNEYMKKNASDFFGFFSYDFYVTYFGLSTQ